jgi:hypothetical protein
MKLTVLSIGLIGLVACSPGPNPEEMTSYTGYKVTCLNGVQYYTSSYKLAVKFNPDSTVATCGTYY